MQKQKQDDILNYYSRNSKKNKNRKAMSQSFICPSIQIASTINQKTRLSITIKNAQSNRPIVTRQKRQLLLPKGNKQKFNVRKMQEAKIIKTERSEEEKIEQYFGAENNNQIETDQKPNYGIEKCNHQTEKQKISNKSEANTFFKKFINNNLCIQSDNKITKQQMQKPKIQIRAAEAQQISHYKKQRINLQGNLSTRLRNLWNSSAQLNQLKNKKYQSIISQLVVSVNSNKKLLKQYHSKASTSLSEIQSALNSASQLKQTSS